MPGLTDLAVRQQRTHGSAADAGRAPRPDRACRSRSGSTCAACPSGCCACRPARPAGSSTTCAASTPATSSAACCRPRPGDHRRHDYENMPGAIPIPATLSIELGKLISAHDGAVKYRFVSDLPFRGPRAPSARRVRAAARSTALRARSRASRWSRSPASLFDRQVRIATPVRHGRGLRRAATTPIPTARSATGRSATCAASRRSRSRSRWAANLLAVQISAALFRARGRGRPRLHPDAAPAGRR